jgi:hypothetical protein
MKRGYNRFFVHEFCGEVLTYVFVDTSKLDYYSVPKQHGFADCVGFDATPSRGDSGISYPVVFEDFTTFGGDDLREIKFEEIPASIKRRYTKWEILQ